MKSLSEIETTSKRASRAAGYSWGVAEEVAKGIRLLELFGFPGIKNLNKYFIEKNSENYKELKMIKKENSMNNLPLCPIVLGVSFLDQVKEIEFFRNCKFEKIGHPILFLPFLSRASEIIGKKILFEFETNKFLLNFNINISSNFLKNDFPSVAKDVSVTFVENKDSFSDKEWKNLYKLSENTFVEETESLKQGAAGAGLTDND